MSRPDEEQNQSKVFQLIRPTSVHDKCKKRSKSTEKLCDLSGVLEKLFIDFAIKLLFLSSTEKVGGNYYFLFVCLFFFCVGWKQEHQKRTISNWIHRPFLLMLFLPVVIWVLQVRLLDTAGTRWLHAHLIPDSTCTNAPFATVSIRKPEREEKKGERNKRK